MNNVFAFGRAVNGEVDYQRRVIAAGYCSAQLCMHADESECRENRGIYAVKPGNMFQGPFIHGDGKRHERSTGYEDFMQDSRCCDEWEY
jgi:hypothetical protein